MKSKLIFFLILIFIKNYSQVNFSNGNVLIDKTHYSEDVSSIVSSDLNNDGFKELVVASSFKNTIMFYRNIGGNIMHSQRILIYQIPDSFVSSSVDIKVGDIDNDGLKDIIAVSSSENKLYWFKNLGNFNFGNIQIIATNINKPKSLSIGDIDNDGDNDIVVGIYNDNNVSLFKNLGNGNFGAQNIIFTTSYGSNKVALKDLDNNGFLDVISGNEDGSIVCSKNVNGTIFNPISTITGFADDGTGFDFIDINNDTYFDIVFSSNYDDKIRYSLNIAGNSFNSNFVTIDNNIQDPYQVVVTDMDNDGLDDIVVSAFANGTSFIKWYKNLSFSFQSMSPLLANNISNPKSFIVDDLNSNGIMEVITSSYDASASVASKRKLSSFEYNSSSSSYDESIINYVFGGLSNFKVADLDNDGNKDIIAAFHNGLVFTKNYGNNQFSSYKTITEIKDILHYVHDVEIGDFNNDGFLDIIWVGKEEVRIYQNNGNLTFTNLYTYPIQLTFSSINVEVADFNTDGNLDFILSYIEGGQTKLFKFIKDNNFNFQTNQIAVNNLNYVKISDLDNDNKIDIIGSQGANFIWLKNDGLANFTQQMSIPMPPNTNKIFAIGDLDNDSYLDLICGHATASSSNRIYFIKNNLNGFNLPVLIDNHGCNALEFGDINNDGHNDVIATFYKSNYPFDEKTFFYVNNSGSSFTSQNIVESLGDAINPYRQLSIQDINGDSKIDIITGYGSLSSIKYFLNTSNLSTNEILDSNQHDFTFVVFPNPSSEKINWLQENKIKNVKIFDSSGKIIIQKETKSNNLNISDLTVGNYYLVAKTKDGKTLRTKFIKK